MVLAAGSGQRFGGSVPKQLVELGGMPLVGWSVRAAAAAGFARIVVVAPATHLAKVREIAVAYASTTELVVVAGGSTRVGSTRMGLEAVPGGDDDVVAIHDAARPLATPALYREVVGAVERGADASTPSLALVDTVAVVEAGRVRSIPPRDGLRAVQTPQAFRRSVLVRAHALAKAADDATATDDCGLVLRYVRDAVVVVVPGEEANLKITTRFDLRLAEMLRRSPT